MHHELVLVDQAQLGQSQRKLHATHAQPLPRLLLQRLNGLPQVPAQELGIPIDAAERARHHVLLHGVDDTGEGVLG
ncbi:hypothetical protein D3C83_157150 [compost metagenome]